MSLLVSKHGNGRHHLDLYWPCYTSSLLFASTAIFVCTILPPKDRQWIFVRCKWPHWRCGQCRYCLILGQPWHAVAAPYRSFLLIFIEFPGRLLLFHTMREGAAGVSGTVALLEVHAKIFLEVSPEWTPGYLGEATRITLGTNLKCLPMPHSSHFARSLWEQDDASLWAHTLTILHLKKGHDSARVYMLLHFI